MNSAVAKAPSGRATVMMGSSRAYVIPMESSPVSGVEIRKEVVAPLLAPLRRRDVATGSTEHEHSGRGMPNREARVTDLRLLPPRCR